MFSFMQTSKSANHMAEAQCRHQLEFKASIRMNMAWLDIRCALEVPGTFQHNHLWGLQRTVWTRERNRRAAVLWEKMCRAWQEGKSDSNNHVLPPKSFSECTSCWKADGLQQHQTTGRHIAQRQTETWGCSMHRLSVADFGTNIITAWIPPALNQWCYSVRDISTSMPFWPQCTNSCRTMCNKAPVL